MQREYANRVLCLSLILRCSSEVSVLLIHRPSGVWEKSIPFGKSGVASASDISNSLAVLICTGVTREQSTSAKAGFASARVATAPSRNLLISHIPSSPPHHHKMRVKSNAIVVNNEGKSTIKLTRNKLWRRLPTFSFLTMAHEAEYPRLRHFSPPRACRR
jgi:hypothetical protein